MGKRSSAEQYFSNVTVFYSLEIPCSSDIIIVDPVLRYDYLRASGDSQQCCTDRIKVYLNSAGKHVDTSYEMHEHAGTWSKKSSQFFSFLLRMSISHRFWD